MAVKNLFLSYAKADAAYLGMLRDGVELLHYSLWIDRNLDAGHVWWEDILEQIRTCDAMIVAVSPALIDSDAAARERSYARQLGKPLLPVLVASVNSAVLPADLASIQFVDLVGADQMAGFRLSNALASLPPAPPLPDPLPEPPPAPISYMSSIADAVRAPDLSHHEQLATVANLRAALERPKEHETALVLLKELAQRRDLFAEVDREISRILAEDHLRQDSEQPAPDPVPPPPQIPESTPKTKDQARLWVLGAGAILILLVAGIFLFRPQPTSSPVPPVVSPTPAVSSQTPTPTPTESSPPASTPPLPFVVLDYTEGKPGLVITVTGYDFIPGETLTLYDVESQVKVQADSFGSFTATVDTTRWVCNSDQYFIRVEDALNNVLATKYYKIFGGTAC